MPMQLPPSANWGLLQGIQQAPQAAPMQMPAPYSSGGMGGGKRGGGGILSGFLSKLFGKSPTSTATEQLQAAISQPSSNIPGGAVNGQIPNYQGSAQAGKLQGMQGQIGAALSQDPRVQQMQQNSKNQMWNIQNVNQMSQQTFSDNPTMAKVAAVQATEESNLLNHPSTLATQYNNPFGIKGQGTAGSVSMPTTEYQNGKMISTPQQFAAYKTPQDAFQAYKQMMTTNPRYKDVINAKTPDEAFQNLQKAGYATDPNYSKTLSGVAGELEKGVASAGNSTVGAGINPGIGGMMGMARNGASAMIGNANAQTKTLSNGGIAPVKDFKSDHDAISSPPNSAGGIPISPELEHSPAFQTGTRAYMQAYKQGITKSPIYAVVDFSQPDNAPRMSIINGQTGKVIMQTQVARGQGHDPTGSMFSNDPNSHASSQGRFITDIQYNGSHGHSMRIRGLDPGVNDNVYNRDVVIHPSNYVGPGHSGRSWGCFALSNTDAPKVINLLKDHSMIYAYGGPQGGSNSSVGAAPAAAQQEPTMANQAGMLASLGKQSMQQMQAMQQQQQQVKSAPQQPPQVAGSLNANTPIQGALSPYFSGNTMGRGM